MSISLAGRVKLKCTDTADSEYELKLLALKLVCRRVGSVSGGPVLHLLFWLELANLSLVPFLQSTVPQLNSVHTTQYTQYTAIIFTFNKSE